MEDDEDREQARAERRKQVGKALKEHREARGKSREWVVDGLDVSPTFLGQIEIGDRAPTIELAQAIAEKLRVPGPERQALLRAVALARVADSRVSAFLEREIDALQRVAQRAREDAVSQWKMRDPAIAQLADALTELDHHGIRKGQPSSMHYLSSLLATALVDLLRRPDAVPVVEMLGAAPPAVRGLLWERFVADLRLAFFVLPPYGPPVEKSEP